MKHFKNIFSFNKISVIFIVLPYLAFNFQDIFNSPYFSLPTLLFFLFVLFLIDVLIKYFINFLGDRKGRLFSLIIFLFISTFFYGIYITDYLQRLISSNFDLNIRGRNLMELCLSLIHI